MSRFFKFGWIAIPAIIGLPYGINKWRKSKPIINKYDDKDLIYVHVFTRHGQRTPVKLESFPNEDPSIWKNLIAQQCKSSNSYLLKDINNDLTGSYLISHRYALDIWHKNSKQTQNFKNKKIIDSFCYDNNHWMGKLTQNGMNEMKDVGEYLRKRYIDNVEFLSSDYLNNDDSKLMINSTTFSRTIFSAYAILQGLYPSDKRTQNLDIPIHVGDPEEFCLLFIPNDRECSYFNTKKKEFKKQLLSNDDEKDRLFQLKEKICNDIGMNPNDISNIQLRAALNVRKPIEMDDINFPYHLETEIGEYNKIITRLKKTLYFDDMELRKLTMGRLLNELIMLMKHETNRFIISSSHDNTIAALKLSINKDFDYWPSYGEHIIFEVWKNKNDNKRYLRVLINGTIHSILDNEEFINLDTLENIWSEIMLNETEWKEYCNKNIILQNEYTQNKGQDDETFAMNDLLWRCGVVMAGLCLF